MSSPHAVPVPTSPENALPVRLPEAGPLRVWVPVDSPVAALEWALKADAPR